MDERSRSLTYEERNPTKKDLALAYKILYIQIGLEATVQVLHKARTKKVII